MSRVDFFLGPQNDDESRLSFGQEVAMAYEAKDESYKHLAQQLALRAKTLLESADELDKLAVEQINENYRRETQPVISWRLNHQLERPVGRKPLKWLASASVRDIALFTTVNRELYDDHRAALARDQPELEEYIMDGIYGLVDADYLPYDSVQIYDQALRHYSNWKPLDAFESGARMVGGYCSDHTIACSNMYRRPVEFKGIGRLFRRVIEHEINHGATRIGERGFCFEHPSGTSVQYFSFLTEALAEHTAAVHEAYMIERDDLMQPEVIHPKKRKDSRNDLGTYSLERTLVSVMDLDVVKLVETELSPEYTYRGERLRAEVLGDMLKSFGSYDALFEFADRYDATEYPSERSKLLKQKIAEITGTTHRSFLDFFRKPQ